ncbi:MAG: LysE family translocator [Paracoccaceae bacterium]
MTDLPPYLPGFLAAYAVLFVGASSPGPAVAMLAGIGLGPGRPAAMLATAGIATGGTLTAALTLSGVGLILSQAAWAVTVIKLVGAGYLAWLSLQAFRKAGRSPVTPVPAPARSHLGYLAMGFAMQVTNPKSIFFWLAIAALAPTQGGGPAVLALFLCGAWALSFALHGAWALLLSSQPFRAVYARARRWMDAALGVFFAFAAIKIATTRTA